MYIQLPLYVTRELINHHLVVEPERENPGQSAKHWNIPIVNACLYVISSNVLAVLGFENFSATIIKIPPATKLMTTGPGPNKLL